MAYRYLKGPPGLAPEKSLVDIEVDTDPYVENAKRIHYFHSTFPVSDLSLCGDRQLPLEVRQRRAKFFKDFF